MTDILTKFEWIDTVDAAESLAENLDAGLNHPFDTEFERSRTFYLNPALLQIAHQNSAYLVDISIPEIAKVVLSAVKKVILHSGSEDLELYHQVTGQVPDSVFDTQVAAAVCGYPLHTSYLNLVLDLFDVTLAKSMSRSDWLARPLSTAQLEYAVEDIAFLDQIKVELTARMDAKGVGPLYDVLMKQMQDNVTQDHHCVRLFQKLHKAEKLNNEQAERLWRLLEWRDDQAKRRNKPRNWVLRPEQMVKIIRQVKHHRDLFELGLHPKFVKLHSEEIMYTLLNESHPGMCKIPSVVKLSAKQGVKLNQMKQRVQQVSSRFGIEPAIIINTQNLKKLAFENGDLEQLATWQALS